MFSGNGSFINEDNFSSKSGRGDLDFLATRDGRLNPISSSEIILDITGGGGGIGGTSRISRDGNSFLGLAGGDFGRGGGETLFFEDLTSSNDCADFGNFDVTDEEESGFERSNKPGTECHQ